MGRYWLTFEDGSKLALYRQTVEDFALYAGKELSEEETRQLYQIVLEKSPVSQ